MFRKTIISAAWVLFLTSTASAAPLEINVDALFFEDGVTRIDGAIVFDSDTFEVLEGG